MIRLQVTEHTRVHRCGEGAALPENSSRDAYLPAREYDALQADDLRRADDSAIKWSHKHGSVGQWVGVIRCRGLELEILPKIDTPGGHDAVRRNLLYMLGISGMVPVRQVDLARLAHRKAPLTDVLVRIFAERLRMELQRGVNRRYVQREEDLRAFKGKLLVSEQVRRFAAHRERFRCRFDEFSADTPMNQAFKRVVEILLASAQATRTSETLRQCLVMLDDVTSVHVTAEAVSRIVVDRKNQRFEDILVFCQLVLSGRSPTARSGDASTYSLLFDMNHVFEGFITHFVRRYVLPTIPDARLFPQARAKARHLMRSREPQRGVLRLKPDLLFELPSGSLIVDTKWKRPGSGKTTRASASDLYQLFAYTTRFEAERSVLLYPHTGGFDQRTLDVLDGVGRGGGACVELRSVNLSRNLWEQAERDALAGELRRLLVPNGEQHRGGAVSVQPEIEARPEGP